MHIVRYLIHLVQILQQSNLVTNLDINLYVEVLASSGARPRASYQIHKIAGCACAGYAENVFPATDFKGNRSLAIPTCIGHVRDARDARAVMHVGIANLRWRGKRSRHSLRMRNTHFYVSDKRHIVLPEKLYNICLF